MRKSRFSEDQNIGVLKIRQAGRVVCYSQLLPEGRHLNDLRWVR
jgi:hypothetical protein